MQYTFGDMIGELFMKALALEEQRKIREEEKAYKDEAMRYQRGRDKTLDERYASERNINDQRYKDTYGLQLAQNQREIDQNNRMEIDTRINRRGKLTPLDQAFINKHKLNPENYPTGEGWEKEFQDPAIFTDPKLESQRYILDDEAARLEDSWYKKEALALDRQRIYAMGNSPEKQEKKRLENTYYKLNEFGEYETEWEKKPGYTTDWMKKNEEQYGGKWIKGSELNTAIGKTKIAKLNYAGPTAISDVTRNSLGNQYASKLFSLKNSPMDALLREFTPQLQSGGNNPQMGVMGLGGNNQYETKAANNQAWTNKKKSNTSFFTGLLNETLNPMAKLLSEASKFRNLNKESKNELNNIEITFGGMYQDLVRLWPVIEGNMIDNVMMPNGKTLKENIYNAIQESKKYYNANKTLIELSLERQTQNAVNKKISDKTANEIIQD